MLSKQRDNNPLTSNADVVMYPSFKKIEPARRHDVAQMPLERSYIRGASPVETSGNDSRSMVTHSTVQDGVGRTHSSTLNSPIVAKEVPVSPVKVRTFQKITKV